MVLPKFIGTIQSKISSGIKKTGQVVFTSDTRRLYWDADTNTRIEITDIIELSTEEERTSLLTPVDKFYYVHETNVLWRYHGGGWKKLGGSDSGGVESFKGRTGEVSPQAGDYTAAMVDARPSTWFPTVTDVGAEPTITVGTASQYYRGDKSWQDFATTARGVVLTGLSTAANAVIAAGDTILAALGKLQAQITSVKTTADAMENNLTSHTNNSTIHVSASEKTAIGTIDSKASTGDLTSHTGNSAIHVTANEKNAIGTIESKASASDLNAHVDDSAIHVTTSEKTAWNAKDKTLIFTNKSVATSAWASDSTYSDFGFRANVACVGVTAAMIPNVVFAPTDAVSGNFAPVSACYAGGVYIYAKEKPTATMTIPTITATGVQ